jgi:hypothetical protein
LGSCAFDVDVTGSGKGKVITTPRGDRIGISAKSTVTATGNGKTADYTINGTFHITTDSDGNIV